MRENKTKKRIQTSTGAMNDEITKVVNFLECFKAHKLKHMKAIN